MKEVDHYSYSPSLPNHNHKDNTNKKCLLPTSLLLEHVLPHLNRITWNHLSVTNQELYQTLEQQLPPWPSYNNNQRPLSLLSSLPARNNNNNRDEEDTKITTTNTIRIKVGESFHTMDTSCNGEWIACGCLDGSIRLWNCRSSSSFSSTTSPPTPSPSSHHHPYEWILTEHSKQVSQVLFSPTNPNCLVSSSWDGTIRIWNLSNLVITSQSSLSSSISSATPTSIAFHSESEQQRDNDDNNDEVVSASSSSSSSGPAAKIAFTNDGQFLASAYLLYFDPDLQTGCHSNIALWSMNDCFRVTNNTTDSTNCTTTTIKKPTCLRRWGTTATGDGRKLLRLAFYDSSSSSSSFHDNRNIKNCDEIVKHNVKNDNGREDVLLDNHQNSTATTTTNQYYLSSLQWCDVLSEEICTWDISTPSTPPLKSTMMNDRTIYSKNSVDQTTFKSESSLSLSSSSSSSSSSPSSCATINTIPPFSTRVSIPRNSTRPGAFSPNNYNYHSNYTTTTTTTTNLSATATTTTTQQQQKSYLATTHQGRRKILLWSLPYGNLEHTLQRYPTKTNNTNTPTTTTTQRRRRRGSRRTITYDESDDTISNNNNSSPPFGLCSLTFSPNGQILASGWEDGSIYLWNIPQGSIRGVISTTTRGESFTNGIWSLLFVNNGCTIVSGDGNQWLKFWNVPPEEEVEEEG